MEAPVINRRESTPPIESEAEEKTLCLNDRLIVTFSGLFNETESQGPDVKDGVQLGTNERICHIQLGARGSAGISATQCTIYVDDQLCLWLRDESRYGTAVEGDYQNKSQVRRLEKWILTSAAGNRPLFESIIIHVGHLALELIFPNHGSQDLKYFENLRKFVVKCESAAGQFRDESSILEDLLIASNSASQAPSGVQTPRERPVYYDRGIIGRGAFAEVRKILQANTGEFLAVKKFLRLGNKRQRDQTDPIWLENIQREFEIMAKHSHPHVVRVFEFWKEPDPQIIMTYYQDGSIADADFMNEALYMTAFAQVLDGLKYLHEKHISHRDLKPENVLVQRKPLFMVAIADFGLSKVMPDDTLLKTFCGTATYAAPEVFPGLSNGHDPLVDIWSLGIMVLQWIYGLPELPVWDPKKVTEFVTSWTERLCLQLDEEEDCSLTEILRKMIEPMARERWTAMRCLSYGLNDRQLFKIRKVDGLLVCVDVDEPPPIDRDTETPTPSSPLVTAGAHSAPRVTSHLPISHHSSCEAGESIRSGLVGDDIKG